MVTKTITWSFFYKGDKAFGGEDIGIKENKNAKFETYLNDLKKQKKRLDTEGVTRIAVFHTLLYDNQCNTEFSPKILALLQELNATFCISVDRIASNESAEIEIQVINENGFKGDNLYQVLDKIRQRPAMYTGEYSLSSIYHFINGFYVARDHETHETPSFDGFNDFVGKFYGKYTTAGWKNLILSDHYGNEGEALTRFFELLHEFRETPNKPDARHIIHKLLHQAFMDNTLNSDQHQQVLDMLKPTSAELHGAIYMHILNWYETLLEDIFMRARDNHFLHNWIKTIAPETAFYEHELWSGSDGKVTVTTLIPSNHKQKDYVLEPFEVLIKRFFTIDNEKAKEVKEAFLAEQDALIDARNAVKKGVKKSKK